MLPESEYLLVVRTDFSDDDAWAEIREVVEADEAPVEFVDDPTFRGLAAEALAALLPDGDEEAAFFVVDEVAVLDDEHPVLAFDPTAEPDEARFRTLPSTLCDVAANLHIANMDFEEFAEAADAEGIYRGI